MENKKRVLQGEVISDKMDKTVIVRVKRTYVHPEFLKVVKSFKKYKVHDEANDAHTGDIVEIYEGRPRSKDKYMYLHQVVERKSSVE